MNFYARHTTTYTRYNIYMNFEHWNFTYGATRCTLANQKLLNALLGTVPAWSEG